MSSHFLHLVRAGCLAFGLALIGGLVSPAALYAGGAPQAVMLDVADGVSVQNGGAIRLQANAPPAPRAYGSFRRFGIAISAPQSFPSSFRSLRVDYKATAPAGSAVLFDVRASADGARWTEWEIDLAPGATAQFDTLARFAQYRVTLLGGPARPAVRAIALTPVAAPALYTAFEDASPPVAPTYRVHATRQGMVGWRTASGHRIRPRDRFVSLPSRRVTSRPGKVEYMVRLTYQGRTTVVPVLDVGPWNVNDNFWDEQRDRFQDLPRGYPEDHAAFFDGYNGGWAEKGKVRFPTAVDVGDGAWWDDLGIRGDRAVIDVTFLWLGADPQGAATPAPVLAPAPAPPAPAAANAVVVTDGSPGFSAEAKIEWEHADGCGEAGYTLWTFTTPNEAESENRVRWQPSLPKEGEYDVYALIPGCKARKPNTTSARYHIQHRDGGADVTIDQKATAGQWVKLGRFPFAAGEGSFVELRDVTGDSLQAIWFDAIRWVPVE
jgi:hypothetical protein